jgi:hypothetical protein
MPSVPPSSKPPQQPRDLSSLEVVRETVNRKKPYLKMAFANPYNLSLFIGGVAASILTANPLPALLACGGEALWLLHAPESRTLRRLLWDPQFEKSRAALEAQERAERMRNLSQRDRDRVNSLVAKEQEINALAAQNPSFTGDLLRGELMKTHKLVDSFLQVALTVARYDDYLHSVDLNMLEKDRERYQQRASNPKLGDQERELAKKNFAVIMKRIEKLRDIRNYLNVARAQLDLIENSFQLIADQIVTMQSPSELSGQLDDLLDGVESIRQTAADTEHLLATIEA